MNTFGHRLRLTTFGESHGPAIGGVVDGFPAGFAVDFEAVAAQMMRRRPGSGAAVSARREPDTVEWLSGLTSEGFTSGGPIAFVIRNADARPADYQAMAEALRPGHADYTWACKYGLPLPAGGGRASARETACRVCAGALARQYLAAMGVEVEARVSMLGGETDPLKMDALLEQARSQGDTLGGVVECIATGVPVGWGEPVYGRLPSLLAGAMMSINAAKGFEYGDGFAMAACRGSQCIDLLEADGHGGITHASNHAGGIEGGVSNGMPIVMRVAFRPIATMMRPIATVTPGGEPAVLEPRGRHDVTAVVRAVPVVEAMAALTLMDAYLMSLR